MFLLPAREADLLSVVTTSVMAKLVISWLADDVTVGAIVLVGTDQSEVILQLAIRPILPSAPTLQPLRFGDPVQQSLVAPGQQFSKVFLMVSLDDQTEGSRPLEVNVELDGWPINGEVGGVAQDWGDLLSKGAVFAIVYHILEVLEADSELGLTGASA